MPQPHLDRSRHELAAFVRARRERLQPAEVGLPVMGRRQAKGLRREEVASLAGIGLTWYTWFEQGRDITVSSAFLDNLCRALRFNATERAYLFSLAGHYVPERATVDERSLPRSLLRLIENLGTQPAYVKNARWDILAWNDAARRVFGDFGSVAAEKRNVLWLAFTDSALRRTMTNWEADARRLVARFRVDHSRVPADLRLQGLVRELEACSADFRRFWREHDLFEKGDGMRTIRVDGIGEVPFDYTVCRIGEADQFKLLIYSPDPATAAGKAFMTDLHDALWDGRVAQAS